MLKGSAPQWSLSVLSTAEPPQISAVSCTLFSALTRYALLSCRMFAYSGMTGEQVRVMCLYLGTGMMSASSLAVPGMLPIQQKLAQDTGLRRDNTQQVVAHPAGRQAGT